MAKASRPLIVPAESVARFWVKVEKSAGCWLWRGARGPRGYGHFKIQQIERAHRVAFAIANGPIPADMFVLHRCDVPTCVNPAHLFLGTQADNMADRDRKGRTGGFVTQHMKKHLSA